jgi:hypothetical protein
MSRLTIVAVVVCLTLAAFWFLMSPSFDKSALYLQHPGMEVLIYTVITRESPNGAGRVAHTGGDGPPHHVGNCGPGDIALYLDLPVELAPKPIGEDEEGPYAILLIPNRTAHPPKRLDVRISPSETPFHIRVVLTANQTDQLFEGDVPVRADDSETPTPSRLENAASL